jgi:hypothetical protein
LIKRTLAVVLSIMVLSTTIVSAQTAGAASADAMRAKVQKLGTGEKARVEVKRSDNTKVKGYISASSDDSFSVTDPKTGTTTKLSYTEIVQVKKSGGISALTWGIIGGAAVAAVIVAVTVISPVLCDGGAGC